MKSKIKSKLTKLLSGGSLFPCVIFYIAGLIWFLLLSQDELNNETYLSENALLVGQVVERFDDLETMNRFYHEAKELTKKEGDMTKLLDWIADQLDAIGLEVYRQNFTFSHGALHPGSKVEGTNVYGIMRSPSGGRTEALLLTVPPRVLFNPVRTTTAGSLALSLALLKTLRGQIYWAKDIVVVFPEFEYVGLLAWIEAYHGAEKTAHLSWTELEGRSGNIQAGLNLEFTTPDIQSVDIFPEGINGLLANLDLVNTVVRLAHKHSIQSVVNGQPYYYLRGDFDSRRRDLSGLLQAVWTQAPGSPTGMHGVLINYQIPAVTLRGPSPYVYSQSPRNPSTGTGKFLEGILRSLNNLQERLHQSFWYYLLPTPLRYISIGVYMPPVLVLIGSLLIKTIGLWIPVLESSQQSAVSESTDGKASATFEESIPEESEELPGNEDQTVRKRHTRPVAEETSSKKLNSTDTYQKRNPKETTETQVNLLSSLADITVWLVAAFGTGLGLFICPQVVFAILRDVRIHTAFASLGVDVKQLSSNEILSCSVIALFVASILLLPVLTRILRRLFGARSDAPILWRRSVVLLTWALFLSCFTCLNVSASVVLSVPVIPFLLIFVQSDARSKLNSTLFGLCWLLVSPLSLAVAGCFSYLMVFDETLLHVTRTVTAPVLWSHFQRAVMQPVMEADLFGSWSWPAFTGGFTSLWLLTWLDITLSP